jgi:leucine dehydrogenase
MVKHVEGIYDTLMEIFVRSEDEQLPTHRVADRIAEERFR